MTVWTTEFPLAYGKSCEDVFAICKKWLTGSQHYSWTPEMLPEILPKGIVRLTHDSEEVEIGTHENQNERWIGFRHCRRAVESVHWTTEVVAYQNGTSTFVSIQLHCFTDLPNVAFPSPNKPYIVKQLLEELGGGLDGGFQVDSKPLYLEEGQVEAAARIIRGDTSNQLPVIYASATWEGRYPLNLEALARKVSAMAHVVVEPSRYFSFSLARKVDEANAYDGAISIYWPQGSSRQTRFLPRYYKESELFTEIIETLRLGVSAKRLDARCTWEVLRELVSRSNLAALQHQGAVELDKFAEEFDAENKAIREQLRQANLEIERLRAEVKKDTRNESNSPILIRGSETPLYQGEIQDIVVQALTMVRNQLFEGGRCQHVIDDLLEKNSVSETRRKLEEELRSTLSKSDGIGRREKRELEALGFELFDDGKHNKLVFANDTRYTFVSAKTVSDHRGTKNFLSDITKKLFK
jgi:hypothetical protein